EFVGNELLTSATMMQQAGLDLSATEIVETLMGKVIDHIRTSVPFRPGALELLPELRAEAVPRVRVTMAYRRVAEAVIHRVPAALELLAELRAEAVPCVMVTMSYRRLAEAVIASCPADSFVGLICGDEVSAGKPDPEPYLKGAGLLGLDPADCVALEDSKPGLASAEAAGTIAVGVPHFVDLEPRPGRILWPSLEGRGVADLRRLRAQQSAQTP